MIVSSSNPTQPEPNTADALGKLRQALRVMQDASPIASRMECAPDVTGRLAAAVQKPRKVYPGMPVVPAMGVPVVVDEGMPAGAWRMLHADGAVLSEGVLWPTP